MTPTIAGSRRVGKSRSLSWEPAGCGPHLWGVSAMPRSPGALTVCKIYVRNSCAAARTSQHGARRPLLICQTYLRNACASEQEGEKGFSFLVKVALLPNSGKQGPKGRGRARFSLPMRR